MTQRTTPPFRADHVGSLLRPRSIKAAREKRAKGEITPAEYNKVWWELRRKYQGIAPATPRGSPTPARTSACAATARSASA